jgi:hypothetical protein
MNKKNQLISKLRFNGLGSYSQCHGETYRSIELITVELHGREHTVPALTDFEAKAAISEEFGFEFNSIRIEDTCWYEAADMNYFLFSARGRQYEVKDFELEISKEI